ncbi:universal stress protein [Alkalihalophilus lindianensis]|uniref:Universal stress protein n=1 Tax=Alkalihalophilus lindianensis TaxID=1630542 RepID=A0ABU3X5S5_9BACI|nr:universal stress protein [Alkalihalophilus lindianensis]MDV2683239.1 universal stress protein [Alkalihalophilus lindianensis]
MSKILLPSDGSEHSIRSAEKAIVLATLYEAQIDVLYVIDGATSKKDVLQHTDKYVIEKRRKERLQPIEERLNQASITYKIHTLHGEPGPTIVHFANEGDYEYVVLGSRGLNKLQTMVLGSVSHKVAKRVDKPVMIVK